MQFLPTECWWINFNEELLGVFFNLLNKLEPVLLKLSKVKTIVLQYGSDIQFFPFSRNLYFKHTMNIHYPQFCRNRVLGNIFRWTKGVIKLCLTVNALTICIIGISF